MKIGKDFDLSKPCQRVHKASLLARMDSLCKRSSAAERQIKLLSCERISLSMILLSEKFWRFQLIAPWITGELGRDIEIDLNY